MKKGLKLILFLILFTFILPESVEGQDYKNDISISIGPSISSFYGNPDLKEFNPRKTFSIGASYCFHYSEYVFFQTGILYEKKGAKVDIDFFDDLGNHYKTSEIIFNRDYLVVPLICSYTIFSRIKLCFEGGLFWGCLLHANDKNSEVPVQNTWAARTKQFDLGIHLGTSIGIPIHEKILIDFAIIENLGLLNSMLNEINTKNNTARLQIGLKYRF